MNSNQDSIYLDYNATAPLRPEARNAILSVLDECGNPSSVHASGRRARSHLSDARAKLAELLGTKASNVVFTSGCTEANMHILSPQYRNGSNFEKLDKLFIGATEHPSVLSGGRFPSEDVEVLPVDGNGLIELEILARKLEWVAEEEKQAIVSIMAVNNETGVIQPMDEISRIVKGAGCIFHVDATQIVGRRSVSLESLGCDVLTLSGHKLGGPQGVGAVVLASEFLHPTPLIKGGGQEYKHRSGTENVAAIAGFGAVIEKVSEFVANMKQIGLYRDLIESELKAKSPDIVIFGEETDRVENTCCFAVPNISAETAVIACDLEDIAISSGSACSSGKVEASHVLDAMGIPSDLAQGALRISLGWANTKGEIERFLQKWRMIVDRLNPQSIKNAA